MLPARPQSTSVSQFEVLDVAWAEDAGGDTLEAALLTHVAAEAGAALNADVAGNPRAMAKLRKQVRAHARRWRIQVRMGGGACGGRLVVREQARGPGREARLHTPPCLACTAQATFGSV